MDDSEKRGEWLAISDEELSAQCTLDFFKAPGNGGQKRNKTSSAVRLIHRPTRIAVTDSVERSQHRNRANALRKLRLAIALTYRCTPPIGGLKAACALTSREYPEWVATIFDALCAAQWEPGRAAEMLGWSKNHLVKMLTRDAVLWQTLGEKRSECDLPFLHP